VFFVIETQKKILDCVSTKAHFFFTKQFFLLRHELVLQKEYEISLVTQVTYLLHYFTPFNEVLYIGRSNDILGWESIGNCQIVFLS
jgi:hypothetical protein